MKIVTRHESTISRTTDHKYLPISKEFVEFKQFFSAQDGVNKGKNQSARAVQTHIRKMIELQLTSKLFSDNILPKILAHL